MKSLIIPAVLTLGAVTTFLSNPVQATDSFKLAVIEGSPESGHILKGDYQQSVQHLALGKPQNKAEPFEAAMSWCVATIKLKRLNQAQQWCDKAVQLAESDKNYRTKMAKFKSLALNNRAIVKYLQDDNRGAYQDFNLALSLYKSTMVKSNHQQFVEQYLTRSFNVNPVK